MAKGMSTGELRRLARLGAAARIEQLQSELAAIRAEFPGLGATRGRKAGTAAAQPGAKPRRRRKKMSAAKRRAISERMKRYWAARRKQKG